jgi:Uma2 family endonuclease
MVTAAQRLATWEDLADVPEGYVGEIVAGELVLQSRPGAPHTETASDLGLVLGPPFRFGRGGPGGWIILHEPRVAFLEDIRVPDLAGWRAERYVAPREGPYTVTPDWVCEVLSPSTGGKDRTQKVPLYARAGVAHVWLVDPFACTLEVLQLSEGRYTLWLTAGGDATLRAPPFDALELELGLIWGNRFEAHKPSE